MSKREVTAELRMEITGLISYLEDLIESLRERKLYVEKDAEVLALSPTEVVEVEIEAKQKKDKESFSLEISWKPPQARVQPTASLKISPRGRHGERKPEE